LDAWKAFNLPHGSHKLKMALGDKKLNSSNLNMFGLKNGGELLKELLTSVLNNDSKCSDKANDGSHAA
jgi:hypothetical protein